MDEATESTHASGATRSLIHMYIWRLASRMVRTCAMCYVLCAMCYELCAMTCVEHALHTALH